MSDGAAKVTNSFGGLSFNPLLFNLDSQDKVEVNHSSMFAEKNCRNLSPLDIM